MSSSSGGVIRFLLFVAIVALGATAYYAYGQSTKLDAYRKANAVLTVKNSELTGAAKAADVKLQESTAKVAELQEQLDTAKKPRARR
jgi:hypothetical protein